MAGKSTGTKRGAWRREKDIPLLAEKLRTIRELRGLSLSEASELTGVANSTLSKIENGKMSPTFDVVTRIMKGLQISPAYLFNGNRSPSSERPAAVDRRKKPIFISIPGADYEILCADNVPKDMFPTMVTLHSHEHTDLATHACEEFVMVFDGALEVAFGEGESVRLDKNDCLYFDRTTPHSFRALGDKPARYLAVSNRTALNAGSDKIERSVSTAQRLREMILR
jgi:transcriptional regulator with XRE-family HTH domain